VASRRRRDREKTRRLMFGFAGTQQQRQHASVRSDGTGRSVAAPLDRASPRSSLSAPPVPALRRRAPKTREAASVRFRPSFRSAMSVPISPDESAREPAVQTRAAKIFLRVLPPANFCQVAPVIDLWTAFTRILFTAFLGPGSFECHSAIFYKSAGTDEDL
jgi:hypothetical protein